MPKIPRYRFTRYINKVIELAGSRLGYQCRNFVFVQDIFKTFLYFKLGESVFTWSRKNLGSMLKMSGMSELRGSHGTLMLYHHFQSRFQPPIFARGMELCDMNLAIMQRQDPDIQVKYARFKKKWNDRTIFVRTYVSQSRREYMQYLKELGINVEEDIEEVVTLNFLVHITVSESAKKDEIKAKLTLNNSGIDVEDITDRKGSTVKMIKANMKELEQKREASLEDLINMGFFNNPLLKVQSEEAPKENVS